MKNQVWAFAKVDDSAARSMVYGIISRGKSRFGMWDQQASLREEHYGKNAFLLRVRPGDWIVHVNMPEYGRCVAVQAVGEYEFDEGIECSWGTDFCNCIPVDPATIVEFDRSDPNVVPSVNLSPRSRAQQIHQVDDFLESLENLRSNAYTKEDADSRGVLHLRSRMERDLLPKITALINEMNKRKDFEKLLHAVFDDMPNTVSIENGYGWGTDHGADLIVEFQNPIIGCNTTSKIIVQAKSYQGDHKDLSAIDQLVEGMRHFDADGGLLITTGNETESLESYAREKSDEVGKAIDIIAGADVARFVMLHKPDLLVGLP